MPKYCCNRFRESVEEKFIIKAIGYDETAWFADEWFHFYYCPFCGAHIKGKGWGTYDRDTKTKPKKKVKKKKPTTGIHFDFAPRKKS